jgi:16S rRNA (cytosine1402-N4)-methyltransferase
MHLSVLVNETIQLLQPQPNDNFIDATFGFGGHSLELLKYTLPNGKILGLEWDPAIIKQTIKMLEDKKQLIKRIKLRQANFRYLKQITEQEGFIQVKGVIFDLGLSSFDLEQSGRGFSFQKDEPLDMRYNQQDIRLTAFEIVNYFSEKQIQQILEVYGEERSAKKIAQQIIQRRKHKRIATSKELAEIVTQVKKFRKKIHPATQTFMALRMFINQELENLREGLQGAYDTIKPGGRIAVISFSGGEDRVIKEVFRLLKQKGGEVITKRVVRPQLKEIKANPRSRSARLRVIEKNFRKSNAKS